MTTIHWQKIEGLLAFLSAFGLALAFGQGTSWWIFALLLIVPDLSVLGYLFGSKVGAFVYNFFHSYGLGLAVVALAFTTAASSIWVIAGLMIVAHVGIDRSMGYGLKDETGFKDTHLGRL